MNSKSLVCPVCEEGTLERRTFSDDFEYNGHTLHVPGLECCVCDICGADPILKDQIKHNHQLVVDARRRSDDLMTGVEIRSLRERLGLTQKEASELFGGGANAFSKYERGDVMQSRVMDTLLRIVAKHPYLLDDLRGGVEEHEGWYSAGAALIHIGTQPPMLDGMHITASNADDWVGIEAVQ